MLNELFFNCDIYQDSPFPFNRNSETESVEEEEEASEEEEEKEKGEKEGEEGQQGGELKKKEEKNSSKVGFQTYNCTNYFQYHHYHHDGFFHKLTIRILPRLRCAVVLGTICKSCKMYLNSQKQSTGTFQLGRIETIRWE